VEIVFPTLRIRIFVLPLAVLEAFSPGVRAQTNRQTPDANIPASAPATRRDLSGVWYPVGSNGGFGQAFPSKQPPPFTAWGRKMFEAANPSSGPREASTSTNDPFLRCDPPGIPRIFFLPRPLEIAYIPGRTLIFYETHNTWREIWTDGRKLPADPDPWWYGHSIGKWEDDFTFLVETVGFNDRTWLDSFGHPHSDQMQLTERYTRPDQDTLVVQITVVDPKAYTKPWVGEPRTYKIRPKWELEESYCSIEDEEGYFNGVTLPAGPAPKPRSSK
jgi:hypothetical protein